MLSGRAQFYLMVGGKPDVILLKDRRMAVAAENTAGGKKWMVMLFEVKIFLLI